MTVTGEIWRCVPSVPGVLVSSEGRVMPMPRTEPTATGYRTYGGIPGWGTWDRKQGRFIVTVNGKTYKVARLVAEAFLGPAPFEGALVLHKDERSSNNRASNLEWGDQRKNMNAPGYIEYCRSRTGESNPRVKAQRKKEADWIRRLRQSDMFNAIMENADR